MPLDSRRNVLLAAVLLLSACSSGEAPAAPSGPSTPQAAPLESPWVQQGGPVVIPRSPFLSDAGMALALERGAFESVGVAFRIEEIRSPNEVFPLFLNGGLDVWSGGVTVAALQAVAEGLDVRFVLPVATLDPEACSPITVVAVPAVAEEFASMMRGTAPVPAKELRIVAEARTLPVQLLRERFRERLEPYRSSVTWFEDVQNAAIPAAMAGGEADVALVNEPWRTTVLSAGLATDVFPATELTPGMVQSVLLIGPRLLADEELAARVIAAYLHGVTLYQEGSTEANVSALARRTGLDPQLLRDACWPTLSLDARSSEPQLTFLQDFAIRQGMFESVIEPADLWRHDIVDRAKELLAVTLP